MLSEGIIGKINSGSSTNPKKSEVRELLAVCNETKKLVLLMNNTADPAEIRDYLGQITNSTIESDVNIFTPFSINYGKNTKIGKHVFINTGCIILDLGGVEIGNDVLIAPRVSILSESHPISREKRGTLETDPIRIGNNVWIGAGATILKGVTIGDNSVVAAGAVVSKDVPANTVVGGIPAKVLNLSV